MKNSPNLDSWKIAKGPYPLGDAWSRRLYFWPIACWYDTLECTCLIYNRRYNRPIVPTIVPPIQIKHVHSSFSYQQAIYQKYNRRGNESPSGYGALRDCKTSTIIIIVIITVIRKPE